MNKKLIIGAVISFIVIGGILLYLAIPSSPSPKEEYSATPTKWSQAGDYKIEETSTGTVVTNEIAGFSFKVPDGWSVEGSESNSHIINILSSDIKFDKNNSIVSGCGIFTAILYQKDEFDYLKRLIQRVASSSMGSQHSEQSEEIVEIAGQEALKTLVFEGDNQPSVRSILIEIPFGEDGIISIEASSPPLFYSECLEKFDETLATTSF